MEWIARIEEDNKIIGQWIQAYYYDWEYLLVIAIAFVYLFIVCKGLRYRWLLPIFAIMFIVLNPILYKWLFHEVVYWRLLWMLPSSLLIATAIVVFIKRQKQVWKKWLVLVATCGLIVTQGYSMFGYGNFESVQNWEKVSQETIEICDIMLKIDENPRAIVSQNLFVEIRQYAPEIELMYGRNAHGHISKIAEVPWGVFRSIEWEAVDYDYVLARAVEYGYNLIVLTEEQEIDTTILKQYGYQEVNRVSGYVIYYYKEKIGDVQENNT